MNDYCNHYIITDESDNIIDGWSTGTSPNRPIDGAILHNEQGGYQFRLLLEGGGASAENPPLRDEYGVFRYRLVNGFAAPKSPQELEDERPEPQEPPPQAGDLTQGQLDFVQGMYDAAGGGQQ